MKTSYDQFDYWFLDFDDTLATGAKTWGYTGAFPKLIKENALPFNRERFIAAFLKAQEQSNLNPNPLPALAELFEAMGWESELRFAFLDDLQTNYRPTLFEDTMPFLTRLADMGKRAFIVSNNPTIPDLVASLGIADLVHDVITPQICGTCLPKPDRSLWHYILDRYPSTVEKRSIMVGDDPWSDGAFAKNCGIAIRLVDRLEILFGHADAGQHYEMVTSLNELAMLG